MFARNPALTLSLTSTAVVREARFVSKQGAETVANALVHGVSVTDATEIGDDFSADVLGVSIVTAGGAVAADALVSSDAEGRAVSGGTKPAARALTAAAAAGEKIQVLLIPNNT